MTSDHPACIVCGKPSTYVDIDGRQSHESCSGESSDARRAAKIASRGGRVSPRWSNADETRAITRTGPPPTFTPLTAAERSRRYRARKAGHDVPRSRPGPKPADWSDLAKVGEAAGRELAEIINSRSMPWAEALERLGVSRDPQRNRDRVSAVQSRRKADRDEAARRVGQLAGAILKARRQCTLAHGDWVRDLSSANLDAVRSGMRARSMLEQELRDLCCSDERLITNVLKAAGG